MVVLKIIKLPRKWSIFQHFCHSRIWHDHAISTDHEERAPRLPPTAASEARCRFGGFRTENGNKIDKKLSDKKFSDKKISDKMFWGNKFLDKKASV
jgi:hypothetical protein